MKLNIAIDGPVASGKTTIAKKVAKELKYSYIDTGAMYRAITWKAIENNINISDEEELCKLGNASKIKIFPTDENSSGYLVFIDGIDITDKITEPSVRNNVSLVASVSGIRRILVKQIGRAHV